MRKSNIISRLGVIVLVGLSVFAVMPIQAQEQNSSPKASIFGTEDGWVQLGMADFVHVNDATDTWTWEGDILHSTGKPIGVFRTQKQYTNFELLIQWKHLKSAGNSGCFVWVPPKALTLLPPNKLPGYGIEVQMLDHGYATQYEERTGKKGDWFTTNGDIFAVGKTILHPFPPLSPNGARSFPSKNLSKGFGEWNQYYVRCINGEVRLWVNGEEVSGGNGAVPSTGYICLEAEGSPIDFKNILIRELP